MRRRFADWEATMPAIPNDAAFHVAFTEAELPRS